MTERPIIEDFREFLFVVWTNHPKIGRKPTRLQDDCAHFMQHGPPRQVILAFRGFGKSWIANTFGVWRLQIDKDDKFLELGSNHIRAKEATTFMWQLLHMKALEPWVGHLRPGKGQRRSITSFDVAGVEPSQDPSVRAMAIHSNLLQGPRATCICPDDIETLKNSATSASRANILESSRELGGAILRSAQEAWDPRISFLGSPQREDSLYWNELPNRGYTMRIYPARYPLEEHIEIYGDRLAPIIRERWEADPDLRKPRGKWKCGGAPTDPERFGEEELLAREDEYKQHGFMRQFMLLPGIDSDLFPLRIRDLVVMDLDGQVGPERAIWSGAEETRLENLKCPGLAGDTFHAPSAIVENRYVKYDYKVMFVDPAGRGADEIAYAVVGYVSGSVALLDVWGALGGYSRNNLRRICEAAQLWKVDEVLTEANWGGGMFTRLLMPELRRYSNARLTEIKSHGQKELRIIDALAPVMQTHRLLVNKEAVQKDWEQTVRRSSDDSVMYSAFYQMARITRQKDSLSHEDRLEAIAGAVAFFADRMDLDLELRAKTNRERERDDAIDDWLRGMELETEELTWTSNMMP